MKLADIADIIKIDSRKFTHYALDDQSPIGQHKAIMFKKLLGFDKNNYLELVLQIKLRVLQAEITFHSEDQFGKRYTAEIEIQGIEGQKEIVKTGWLIGLNSTEAHLTTLYIKKTGAKC
ncbi:MAG: hypothetical protein GQ569_13005 [Methylococcaceae bacterium]|nr:hypothetical protein [Methylococcaceae bacterium]